MAKFIFKGKTYDTDKMKLIDSVTTGFTQYQVYKTEAGTKFHLIKYITGKIDVKEVINNESIDIMSGKAVTNE
jgi:hypothetical protein